MPVLDGPPDEAGGLVLFAHDLRSTYLLPEGGLADHHDEFRLLGAQDGPLPRGHGVRHPALSSFPLCSIFPFSGA
jgi:hypothetical protein